MTIQWGELWRTPEEALIEHNDYGPLTLKFPRHDIAEFYYAIDADEDDPEPVIVMFRSDTQDYSAKYAPFLHECHYVYWTGVKIDFDDMVAMFCERPDYRQERLNWTALEQLYLEAPAIIQALEEAACAYEDASNWKENVQHRLLQTSDVRNPDVEGLAEYIDSALTMGYSVHTHIKLAGGAFCIVSSYNGPLGKGARCDYADHAGSSPRVEHVVCVERAHDPTANNKHTITVTHVDEYGERFPDEPPYAKPIVYVHR